jgi:iron complex transport system permease protein
MKNRKPFTPSKLIKVLSFFLLLLLFSFFLSIITGSVKIGLKSAVTSILKPDESEVSKIIFHIRLPRFLMGAIAGWSLCLSGAVFQGILRNPLADSYVLGVASASALGAVIDRLISLKIAFLGFPLFSFFLASFAIAFVYYMGMVNGTLNTGRMILAGVILGTFFSACITFLLTLLPKKELQGIFFWLLGDLSSAEIKSVVKVIPWVVIASVPVLIISHRLNLLSAGEEEASALGVNPKSTLTIFFLLSSFLTASIVSQCGAVGFVGLIVPHLIRIVFGPDARLLLPASGIAGASFLVLSDIVAKTILSPSEIPIGIITAFFGAPFFLYLLKWKRR